MAGFIKCRTMCEFQLRRGGEGLGRKIVTEIVFVEVSFLRLVLYKNNSEKTRAKYQTDPSVFCIKDCQQYCRQVT